MAAYRDFVAGCAREVAAGARVEDAVSAAGTVPLPGREEQQLARIATCIAAEVSLGATPERLGKATSDHEELVEFCRLWGIARKRGLSFAPLADGVVADADTKLAQQEKSAAAMAGARLTEILLLALPVGALFVGQSMGLGPVEILLNNVLGLALMLAGSMLACAGRDSHPAQLQAARQLDIFALALEAGLPVAHSWRVATTAAEPEHQATTETGPESAVLHQVACLLELGAGPAAWEPLVRHPHYGPIARQACQQARAGTTLVFGAKAHADRLRTTALRQTEAGAERVLIALAAPLTLCFLPAFVLVGLVPLVAGLAGL